MIGVLRASVAFPKSARLLKPSDFRFRSYRRFESPYFKILYCSEGTGRLGISISKKVLRRAVARNRARRLVKEAFRHHRSTLPHCDVHVVGLAALKTTWQDLTRSDLDNLFRDLFRGMKPPSQGK